MEAGCREDGEILIEIYFRRKISAHEFERGGLLKPIVNTIDGTPTFLSVDPHQNESQCLSGSHVSVNGSTSGNAAERGSGSSAGGTCGVLGNGGPSGTGGGAHTLGVAGLTASGRPQRLSRNELRQLDEKELIFELVR